jgi:hypothetical protein
MTPRTRKLLVALGLAGILGLWLQYREPAAPGAAVAPLDPDAAPRTSRAGGRPAKTVVRKVEELRVERLEQGGGEFSTGRNLFAFYVPPPPPPPAPRQPTAAELAAQAAAQEAARLAAVESARVAAIEAAKPKPPIVTFTYLGSFGRDDRKVAVFADGETIFNALLGEVLMGKFRLVSIGFESVELSYVDFPDLRPAQLPVGQKGS